MKLPQINVEKTGANIKRLMKENGYTIAKLQSVFGFHTNQAICKWIYGKTIPKIDNLIALSRLFGVTVEEIIVLDDVK